MLGNAGLALLRIEATCDAAVRHECRNPGTPVHVTRMLCTHWPQHGIPFHTPRMTPCDSKTAFRLASPAPVKTCACFQGFPARARSGVFAQLDAGLRITSGAARCSPQRRGERRSATQGLSSLPDPIGDPKTATLVCLFPGAAPYTEVCDACQFLQ